MNLACPFFGRRLLKLANCAAFFIPLLAAAIPLRAGAQVSLTNPDGPVALTNPQGPLAVTIPAGAKAGERSVIAGIVFRWCPPGRFLMGSAENEADRNNDERQHRVNLTRGFWLAETELTQAQWKAVMGSNPSNFKGDDLPVECVSWGEALEWCRKKAESSGLPKGWRLTLPSEAQWEYACRAGTTTLFSFGNSATSKQANFRGKDTTVKVGSYPPNGWGLRDMHGNVGEWCLDWHADEYPLQQEIDPEGVPENSWHERVVRGGSWNGDPAHSAARGRINPGARNWDIGFRPALVQPHDAGAAGPANPQGPVALTGAPVALTGAPVALTDGTTPLTGGGAALTGAPVSLTSGQVSLTSGQVSLTTGQVALTTGQVALTAPGGPIALTNSKVPAEVLVSSWTGPKKGAEPVAVAMRRTLDANAQTVEVKVDAKSMQGFQNIQFKLDSAQLEGVVTFRQLEEIAKAMNQSGAEKFLIEGHTCDLGGDLHNKVLSQHRAESVVAQLVSLHVSPSRLQALGFGAEQPFVANTSEKQRAKNRRVQIYRRL